MVSYFITAVNWDALFSWSLVNTVYQTPTKKCTPILLYIWYLNCSIIQGVPGQVTQSVTCLTTDVSLTADPGVASLIPAESHTFVEIDHEIISMVILLPSAKSFKKGCCQLQAKVCARSTG